MLEDTCLRIPVRMTISGDMLFFLDHTTLKPAFSQNAGNHRACQTCADDQEFHFLSAAFNSLSGQNLKLRAHYKPLTQTENSICMRLLQMLAE